MTSAVRRPAKQIARIGVDESNNRRTSGDLPLVLAAYTLHAGESVPRPMGKHGAIKKTVEGRNRFAGRAVPFLREANNFLYCTVPVGLDKVAYSRIRAIATARLICEAVIRLECEPFEVVVDGHPFNETVQEVVRYALVDYGVPSEAVFFEPRADKRYNAVKLADRVAYAITGLRRGRRSRRWPYVGHKVNLHNLPSIDRKRLEARLDE